MSDCPDPFPQSQSSGETLTLVGMAPALYVGELHPDVAESNLFELFSTVGTVTSVRVCKDRDSGRSLGYGYVNYMFEQDAINAIEKLNHNELFGKPIRIMQANRNADTRSSGIGNVFVKNLSESVNDLELEAMFGKFGTILSSKMAIQDGKSKGYGFVQFDSQDSANAAIENLHGTFVDGKQIYVSNFIKKSERILPNPETMYNSLFVKNLDEDITEELIELKFSEFGEVANVKLAKDEAGNSKGYGFVNFENQESAEKAMEAMNGLKLGSKTLFVARAQRKEELQQNLQHTSEHIRFNWDTNLYVKNLDDSVDDSALSEYFSKCGTVISAKVMRDEKGSSKGFGFVCYTTLGEATKALNNLHGNMFHGKPLYVAFAQRNEERQAQLQYHHFQKMAGLVGPGPALSSSGYPPLYYRTPGVVPLIPSQHGLVQHQPFWLRPGWGPSEFVSPTRPIFQPMPLPVVRPCCLFSFNW
ncbi:polyadenylate-binding protein 7-like [Phalaenopsis equestris]|uniref:polyadenylate-binding protein 7-like n=1 Tax=Phalaenopsis equestris TaxID=78828 RepID=UPI0009E479D3|nr:polyadenylate-binding protein 7-like [Phalaenopsis equestris]